MVLVRGDCRKESQSIPTTQDFWFWLEGIAERNLSLSQPHPGPWFWLKGIAERNLSLAQPYTGFWFWLEGIAERNLSLAQPYTFLGYGKRGSAKGSQFNLIGKDFSSG